MKIFLAGIVQGSIKEKGMHEQTYRDRIKTVVRRAIPRCEIYCPIENHPRALDYDEREGRSTFFAHASLAADSDCVIAYVPEATMGTAIEMWEGYNNGQPVLTISPLKENWTVKFLSDKVFETIEAFETFVDSGELKDLLWSDEEEEIFEEEEEEETEYEDEEEEEKENEEKEEEEYEDEEDGDESEESEAELVE